MADGSRHSLYQILESTYGVTPGTPSFSKIRHVGTSLGLAKGANQSEELRADRQIADFRHGTKQIGGDISAELSYTSFDDQLEAVLGGTWAVGVPIVGTDQLKAGVLRRSYSMLRNFEDLAVGDNPFHLFSGCEYNTMAISINPDGIATITFGVIGKGMSTAGTAPAGSVLGAAATTSVFDSFTGTINEASAAIAVVTELSLNLDNGIAPRFVVGSPETILPEIGRSNLTGSLTAFFENATLLDKFINETPSDLDFTLTDLAGNALKFIVPNLKYSGGQPDVSGQGSITLSMPFQAIYDATNASQILVERNPI